MLKALRLLVKAQVKENKMAFSKKTVLEAAVAAQEVLSVCCADRELPIDPIQIADSMGLQVKPVRAKPNVAGGLLKTKDSPPIIFFNKDDAETRRRFTIAHELGHYYRHFAEQHEFEYMDYRDQISSTGLDPEEVFANQFAANLLMPEDLVRKRFEFPVKMSERAKTLALAGIFSVSADAMSIRLKTLGLIEDKR